MGKGGRREIDEERKGKKDVVDGNVGATGRRMVE